MTRQVDPHFQGSEALWRRIEKRHVDAKSTTLKGSALRLQVSMVRELYGDRNLVTDGKFNGVAEISAGDASSVSFGDARFVVVDEPLRELEGHALVAIVVDPGKTAPQDALNAAREQLALRFRIIQSPT